MGEHTVEADPRNGICPVIVSHVFGLPNRCVWQAGHEGPHQGIDTRVTQDEDLNGQRMFTENPECFKRHGDFVHGRHPTASLWFDPKVDAFVTSSRRDCAPAGETRSWWSIFAAVLNPATRPWLKWVATENTDGRGAPSSIVVPRLVSAAADIADAAIIEAKRRGRL